MNIIKHEELCKGIHIFNLTDEVGRVWQTVGTDEKDAKKTWAEGEDVCTFIVRDVKPDTLTVDYLIKSLNIKRNAIIVIQLMHEILNTDAKREEFYAETLGYNAAGKMGCKLISKVLFRMKKEAESIKSLVLI
ncbi:hypothetical protein [Paenibacillus sp. FSL H3-0286]|uniref:hypothetical protein n=1 Tax=Paenibacillus sp. FSL H3-0286 TaxID=2921427 RepID=UPI003249F066